MAVTRADVLGELAYSPKTGLFTRLTCRGNQKPGSIAGAFVTGGVRIRVCGQPFLAHRLAWLCVHGEWPEGDLDHINGNSRDNRIANLRPCDDSQNQANRKLSSLNTSGFKGVCWNAKSGKWQAGIKVRGKSYHLGLFTDPAEAHAAYLKAAHEFFGEFARAA